MYLRQFASDFGLSFLDLFQNSDKKTPFGKYDDHHKTSCNYIYISKVNAISISHAKHFPQFISNSVSDLKASEASFTDSRLFMLQKKKQTEIKIVLIDSFHESKIIACQNIRGGS